MIRSIKLAILLMLAGGAQVWAAPPPVPDKGTAQPPSQTTVLLNYFVDFCVGAYPNLDTLHNAVKEAGFKPANAADSAVLLDKSPGEVWTLVKSGITYYAGINSPPIQMCTVAANLDQTDDTTEATFTTVVSGVLGSIGKGELAPAQIKSRPGPGGGTVKLSISPLSSQDLLPQIFVNALLTQPGHAPQTRFMRVFTHPK